MDLFDVASENTETMQQLLSLGADPNVSSIEGATPLMNAVQSKKMLQVLLLLKSGANVNARDIRGFTSLHRAAEMGHKDIVRILLENGADKHVAAEGYTAVALAEMRGQLEIAGMLR